MGGSLRTAGPAAHATKRYGAIVHGGGAQNDDGPKDAAMRAPSGPVVPSRLAQGAQSMSVTPITSQKLPQPICTEPGPSRRLQVVNSVQGRASPYETSAE